jgi:CheY-like chemotaxis protein
VDDEKNIRLTVSRALEPLGMPIETASDGEEALRKLEEEGVSLLLLDLKMQGMDGMAVLETVRRRWPSVLVVILTAYGNIDIAVDAMKMGPRTSSRSLHRRDVKKLNFHLCCGPLSVFPATGSLSMAVNAINEAGGGVGFGLISSGEFIG